MKQATRLFAIGNRSGEKQHENYGNVQKVEDGVKQKVMVETEIDVYEIRMDLAVRYDEEDIPNDFPCRHGNILSLHVEVDSGRILNWPDSAPDADVYMKVCDQGSYQLFGPAGEPMKRLEDEYVPHGLVPGEYGDYVDFKIKGGVITNWPKHPSLRDFYPE